MSFPKILDGEKNKDTVRVETARLFIHGGRAIKDTNIHTKEASRTIIRFFRNNR